MPAATVVGIFVRVAGVWNRATPHVRQGGSWHECKYVWVKDSGVWKVVWADDTLALGSPGIGASSLAFVPPYEAQAGVQILGSGIEKRKQLPGVPSYTDYGTPWLLYDLERTYQVKYTVTGSHQLATVPTLGSWINLSGTHTFETALLTSSGDKYGNFSMDVRRNEGTPTGILASGTINVYAEVL